MTKLFRLSFCLFLYFISAYISASPAIYESTVILDNQKAANSTDVLKQGLLQVLIKLTGKQDIDALLPIQQALEKPENYLIKYSTQITEDLTTQTKQRVSLQSYAASRVDLLLKNSKITLPSIDNSDAIDIRVGNINTLESYAQINNYLNTLAVINNVTIKQLNNGWLDLSISTKSGREALLNILKQDSKLVQDDQASAKVGQLDSSQSLQFRWN